MNIFTRILLVLCAVIFIFVSSLSMIIALRHDVLFDVYRYLSTLIETNSYSTLVIILFSLAFLFIGIVTLISGVKLNRDKKSVSKYTNMGEVKISLATIDDIVLNTAGKFGEIRDISTLIRKVADNVSITVRASVLPDVCIPALSGKIQEEVKFAVEESTGILVEDVRMFVQNIYSGHLPAAAGVKLEARGGKPGVSGEKPEVRDEKSNKS
ncbi:MAG TPA: alkaline shock response membrane anchor protein AmaP [Clostridiales bacterium]|nr:alkaline shock response membrane anchor protein AmaP [Clostridiales bacterium]